MRPKFGKRPHSNLLLGVSPASYSKLRTERNRMSGHSRKDSMPDLSANKPIKSELLVTRVLGLTRVKMKHRKKGSNKGLDG